MGGRLTVTPYSLQTIEQSLAELLLGVSQPARTILVVVRPELDDQDVPPIGRDAGQRLVRRSRLPLSSGVRRHVLLILRFRRA